MRISLSMPPGIVSDETTFSTPGYWADGSNVRFRASRPEVIGGWSIAHATAVSGVCRNVHSWSDNLGEDIQAFGTHTHLMVLKAGTLTNITPSGMAAGNIDSASGPGYGTGGYGLGGYGSSATSEYWARTWSISNYGSFAIANYRGGPLYDWDNDVGNLAAVIATAPDTITCSLVTPERIVMALGCNEEVSTTFNPMCVRWSNIEDYTDWTTAAASNAGEHILEGGGRIVGARLFGSYIAIWTDTAVHLGQFVGAAEQTFRFDLVASNCGLAGPNAVTVINQVAYWITPDFQIYAWQLGGAPGPVKCPILNDFQDNLDRQQVDKIVCTGVTQYNEVWWFYPDARDGDENSRYIAINTQDGAWFRGMMERTAAIDSGPAQYPLFVTYDGYAYWHENGLSANGSALSWFIKSSDQYLDEAENWFLLKGVWPDFEDQVGAISMHLYTRNYPASAETERGPYVLPAGREKKDFMVQGRIVSLEFSGESAPAFMRLGKPSFDAVRTGRQ